MKRLLVSLTLAALATPALAYDPYDITPKGFGGGAVGLIIGEQNTQRVVLAGVGIIFSGLGFVYLWRQRRAIRQTIASMEDAA
jgi:hypothetical protein